MRRPIVGDVAGERHHCRWYLRSLEYCWLRNQPVHGRSRTQQGAVAGCSGIVGSRSKMQQPGVPAHYCILPKQCCTPSTTEVCDPLVSTQTTEVGVVVVVVAEVSRADRGFKHIAPDTPSSRHRKVEGGLASSAPHHHDALWTRLPCGQVRPLC